MQQNDYDLLLTWASSKGNGNWVQWRNACINWKQASPDQDDSASKFAWQARYAFSALGHVDFEPGFEFRNNGVLWQAAPACFAITPGSTTGLIKATLCGCRCEDLLQQLTNHLGSDRIRMIEQQGGPLCVQVEVENEANLNELCDRFQLINAGIAAEKILRVLPKLEDWLALTRQAADPVRPPFEVYDAQDDKWMNDRFDLLETDIVLIRTPTQYDFYRYYLKYDGKWMTISKGLGLCMAWRKSPRSMIRYDERNRQLYLYLNWKRLPALYLRCLILCNGLLPNYERSKKAFIIKNVPCFIAHGIAQRLQQSLEEFHA